MCSLTLDWKFLLWLESRWKILIFQSIWVLIIILYIIWNYGSFLCCCKSFKNKLWTIFSVKLNWENLFWLPALLIRYSFKCYLYKLVYFHLSQLYIFNCQSPSLFFYFYRFTSLIKKNYISYLIILTFFNTKHCADLMTDWVTKVSLHAKLQLVSFWLGL